MKPHDVSFLLICKIIYHLSFFSLPGFVPFPSIADWIVWLQWISPIKYSFQAFTCSLFSGTPNANLLDKLELDAPTGVSANIGISSGIFIICALGSVFALSRQREVR